jgi:hypothetical protein
MNKMETIIIPADETKMKGLIAFLKAFNISYEIKNETKSPYNPDFIKKIGKAKKEPGKPVTASSLWEDIK